MSFKKFLMATSFIASVSALPAMAADTIYFSGLNVCEGKRLVNSWKISIEEDGSSLIEVYQQPTTRGNISKKDYAGEGTGDGLLLTQNGRSLASVTVPADLSYVEGHWLNRAGDPNPDCEPFKFTNSGSPRDNFDTLLALYEVKDPTLEQAVEAAHLQRLLPPPHLLSELDQRSYQKRHEDSFSPFWRGFFEVQLTRMREMPIETAEDRENYIATVRQVTEFDFGPLGTLAESGATKDFAANVLRVAADRLADTDAPLMALPVSADTTCLVVRGFGRLEDDEFTLIAGLPTDYWTRDYAEVLLNVGRDCRKDFAKVFTNAYPRIEERQRQVEWVRAERKRLMEAPVTLAGFKESNWLSLDDELRRQNNISNDMVQRFIGDSLKSRREEMVQVSLEEITTEMDSKDIKTLTFADANKFCEEKLGRKPRRAEGLDALFDGCDAAAAAYEDTQNEKIVSERVAVALAAPKTLQGLRDADWFRLKSGEFTDWYPSREVLGCSSGHAGA